MFVCFLILFPLWAPQSHSQNLFHLFFPLFSSAYRVPRRRFSTGGNEESWSQSLQRVRDSLFSILTASHWWCSNLQKQTNAILMTQHANCLSKLFLLFFHSLLHWVSSCPWLFFFSLPSLSPLRLGVASGGWSWRRRWKPDLVSMTMTPGAVQGILAVGARKPSTQQATAHRPTTTPSMAVRIPPPPVEYFHFSLQVHKCLILWLCFCSATCLPEGSQGVVLLLGFELRPEGMIYATQGGYEGSQLGGWLRKKFTELAQHPMSDLKSTIGSSWTFFDKSRFFFQVS